jgi:hypothetical protein
VSVCWNAVIAAPNRVICAPARVADTADRLPDMVMSGVFKAGVAMTPDSPGT